MSGRPSLGVLICASGMLWLLTSDQCDAGCFDCLFGRNKKTTTTVTPVPATPTVTMGYAPVSCGAASCKQTIVQYMPQIAYRTAWQQVPVTTYQTSTSINPANGLPITCTRPCTSYRYQAARVPYTTYKPVYTTVPVSLPACGAGCNPQAGAVAPAAPYGYSQPQAAPPMTSPPVTAPPLTAPSVPAQPGTTPGATPWAPMSTPAPSQTPGATQWQAAPNQGAGQAPTQSPLQSQEPANVAPSLRPQIDSQLQPVPQTFAYPPKPRNDVDPAPSLRVPDTPRDSATSPTQSTSGSHAWTNLPSRSQQENGYWPQLDGPDNQSRDRSFEYNRRAVPDLDGQAAPDTYNPPASNSRDKTAMSPRPRPRYAAVSIYRPEIEPDQLPSQAPITPIAAASSEREPDNRSRSTRRNEGSRWNDQGWRPTP